MGSMGQIPQYGQSGQGYMGGGQQGATYMGGGSPGATYAGGSYDSSSSQSNQANVPMPVMAQGTDYSGRAVGTGPTGGYATSMANAGPIQRDIAGQPYYTQAAETAYMDQAKRTLDPQWKQTQDDMESKLVNMGLSRGSEAWNREASNYMRNRTDAYQTAQNSAILNAGAEGTRMQGMDLSQGNFRNQAQNQQYTQNLGAADLQNRGRAGYDSALVAAQNAATGSYAAQSQNQTANRGLDVQSQLGNRGYDVQSQLGNRGYDIQSQTANRGYDIQSQLGNRNADIGQYTALSNNALGNRAQDTSAFSAYNQADVASRGADTNAFTAYNNAYVNQGQLANQTQQQQFNIGQTMRTAPYNEQNLAMGGQYPTGAPTYPGYGTPSANGSAGGGAGYSGQVSGGINQQGAGYGNIAGSLGGYMISPNGYGAPNYQTMPYYPQYIPPPATQMTPYTP
jgi:hypothetical protein